MSYSQTLWSKVMTISQKMLDHSQQDNWPEVTEIELQRQLLIKQYFDGSIPLSATTIVRDNIKWLMKLDQEISCLCEKKRSLIAADINEHRHSRKACQSYQQCG